VQRHKGAWLRTLIKEAADENQRPYIILRADPGFQTLLKGLGFANPE
jgi:hypothetical protein